MKLSMYSPFLEMTTKFKSPPPSVGVFHVSLLEILQNTWCTQSRAHFICLDQIYCFEFLRVYNNQGLYPFPRYLVVLVALWAMSNFPKLLFIFHPFFLLEILELSIGEFPWWPNIWFLQQMHLFLMFTKTIPCVW